MKRLNKFSRLPQEDQTHILNLCAKLPYRAVAEQIARPRAEGGLDFTTCVSALCKFNTHHHPDAVATEAIGQYSAAIQIHHQAHGEANFEAILSLVQTRILTALRAGKSVADLDREFRNLQRVQKCFLDDAKYRHKNEHTQDAYLDHVKRIALIDDEPDFVDHTLADDPGADGRTAEDLQLDETQLERDVDFAKYLPGAEVLPDPTYFREAARLVAAHRLAARKQQYLRDHKINSAFPNPQPTTEDLLKLHRQLERQQEKQLEQTEISNQNPSKTPAISSISNNFHSPETKGSTV